MGQIIIAMTNVSAVGRLGFDQKKWIVAISRHPLRTSIPNFNKIGNASLH